MRASSLVLTLVAAAVTGVGCGTTCTAMGCSDAVTVDVGAVAPGGDGAMVDLCVDGRCVERDLEGAHPVVSAPLGEVPAGETVQVTVGVDGGTGRDPFRTVTAATVTSYRPNGPDCPGECRVVALTIAADGSARTGLPDRTRDVRPTPGVLVGPRRR